MELSRFALGRSTWRPSRNHLKGLSSFESQSNVSKFTEYELEAYKEDHCGKELDIVDLLKEEYWKESRLIAPLLIYLSR